MSMKQMPGWTLSVWCPGAPEAEVDILFDRLAQMAIAFPREGWDPHVGAELVRDESTVEQPVANPERVDNGSMIYRSARSGGTR
jgi:hypothetical protein